MSRVLARYTIVNDTVADARRAEDAAWLDLHRRPDALPDPAATPEPERSSRLTMGSFVRRLTGLRTGPG